MSDPTPQPDPSEVLTDAERQLIARAKCEHDYGASLLDAVERIVAARTADADARLAAVESLLAAWHGKRRNHERSPTWTFVTSRLREALAATDSGAESVGVVRGWRCYPDGSQSPVERWVKHADGDWVSLDSTRRTSGDILMEV